MDLNAQFLDNVHINFDSGTLWVMNLALALVMFGIALELSFSDFKRVISNPKPVLVGVLSQFMVLPVLTYCLVVLIEPMPSMALGMFMVAACPGGNVSNFISHLAGGNTALSVSLTAMATILAVVMTPFNLQFWGGMYPPSADILQSVSISFLEMARLVLILLGIPLVVGMWVHKKFPTMARQMARFLKTMSLIFFIALVFLALYKDQDVFFKYVSYVFWLVLAHNFLAFLCGFLLGRSFRLPKRDIKSITIETGIQNSGLGLLLIFSFFDGLGGMALLAAFWGIWHLISGLLLAGLWGSFKIGYKPKEV